MNKPLKIFERYNPSNKVRRCPNGRGIVKKLLNQYAIAAVNLYGFIKIEEFVEIFNQQNEAQTTSEEVFNLLLPLIIKKEDYCFYKDFLVHPHSIEDFNYADSWIKVQQGKPRYIPDKDEFLKFEFYDYEAEIQYKYWDKIWIYIKTQWPEVIKCYSLFEEMKQISEFSSGIKETNVLFEKYNVHFKDEEQIQEFYQLFIEARNHTRFWSNNGYTPNELGKLLKKKKVNVRKSKKIGVNDPCYCGSGEKYKKCCRL